MIPTVLTLKDNLETGGNMKREAVAIWKGNLREGKGELTTGSKALVSAPYSFRTRFANEPGTNPEELIAAAHAGCFSMALSAQLAEAGLTPEKIETQASINLEKQGTGFAITTIHLKVAAKVPNADDKVFEEAVQTAKKNCPVSKVLKADITMDAQLVK